MTLRARLAVAYLAAAVAVVAMGAAVVLTQRHYLMDQVDDRLLAAAAPVARIDPFGPPAADRPAPTVPSEQPPEGSDPNTTGMLNALWIGQVDAQGNLRTLPSVFDQGNVPDVDAEDLLRAPPGEPFTVGSTTGSAGFRLLVLPVRPAESGSGAPSSGAPGGPLPGSVAPRVAFGAPLEDLEAAVDRLVAVVLWGGGGILAVLAISGWWVWRLGLRPIRDMTAAADRIAAGDRDLLVPGATEGTEAGRLAEALNTMLDSRRRSEEQLRRFVGDASHELRTPLTSVRGYAELYQRGALSESSDLDDAMRRILAESERMAVLIDDLLLLARLDQGRPLEVGPVDLAAVLDDAGADARAISPQRSVTVEVPRPLMVIGDEHRLRQVVAGLVANALVHTDAAVHLRGWVDPDGRVGASVRDEGPGMDARTAEQAFDRFFRGDPARSRHTGGSGLGLAIARSVVEAHGGRIELHSAPHEGCTVELHLPGVSSSEQVEPGASAGTVQL